MILYLDAGNSRLKYGLHDGSAWLIQGALAYQESQVLVDLLPLRPRRIVACNVAGAAGRQRIERLAQALDAQLAWFTSTAACGGVRNDYEQPEQLGADRWAALIGAHALHDGPALVVMAGTATTIDVLEAGGSFRGGLILPGLDLMRQALASGTAALRPMQGVPRLLPRNTGDAIASGALEATIGAIERMARRLARTDFAIILAGGAAGELLPGLERPVRHVEHLVLEGLLRAD